MKYKNRIPTFQNLEAIAKALGDTENGLTGSQIGNYLRASSIPDTDPGCTKWKRLLNAFDTFQKAHKVGNHVIFFINNVMHPSRYIKNEEKFSWLQKELNIALSFSGHEVGDNGKVKNAQKSQTLSEAKKRENGLREKLIRRNAHTEILKFCKAELLENNYFHAVFESVKSVTSRIREMASIDGDGIQLVDSAFSFQSTVNPKIAINLLNTQTLKGEQKGFIHLLKGLYGTFRNPSGHEARIEWKMSEADALDILSLISLIHRKLDKSYLPHKL